MEKVRIEFWMGLIAATLFAILMFSTEAEAAGPLDGVTITLPNGPLVMAASLASRHQKLDDALKKMRASYDTLVVKEDNERVRELYRSQLVAAAKVVNFQLASDVLDKLTEMAMAVSFIKAAQGDKSFVSRSFMEMAPRAQAAGQQMFWSHISCDGAGHCASL